MTKRQPANGQVRREARALLRNRCFFHEVGMAIQEQGVLGESRNGLAIFNAGLTRVFERPVSAMLKGDPSTGKNNLVGAVVALFPPENVLRRSSLSGKAPAYGKQSLAGNILYLFQYEGGRDAQLLIRLLQSEGALEHEYTDVKGHTTRVTRRKGAPVILTTTTSQEVYADDETRFLSLRSDQSEELTRQVIRATLAGGSSCAE